MDNEKPNGLHLILPFPDAILNPNAHTHWSKKHRPKKDLFESCFWLTKERGVVLEQGREYRVELLFCPPDRRRRDRDNLQASYKSGLDGMCLALGIDDSSIHPVSDIGPVVEGGKVEVRIYNLNKT